MRSRRPLAIAMSIALLAISTDRAAATALDDYVAAYDSNYSHSRENTRIGLGYAAYVIEMTSQAWRSPTEVDRTLWTHWLTVIVPFAAADGTAMLIIEGGDNGDPAPRPTLLDADVVMALASNTVVATLYMVPNQPLYFADELDGRSEDAIIAYSWDKFFTTADATWPVQLPMVKSAVRAMDTVQDFCADLGLLSVTIDQFVVGGGSKRGWTTWLTAAVDARVAAIAPLVIDLLNMPASFRHHFSAYGFWAPAVSDYEEMGIFDWLGTEQMAELLAIVDPYLYHGRFVELPKFLINSAGDDFFLPDSSQYYYHELAEPKRLRYVPNTNHAMEGATDDIAVSLLGYYQDFLANEPIPQFSWTIGSDGGIFVYVSDTPDAVYLWQASNPTARDFRLATIGPAWTASELTDQGGGLYIGDVPVPQFGWTAFFVELSFDGDRHIFTTDVNVLPGYLPFASDFDFSGSTDVADLAYLASRWLNDGCLPENYFCNGADLDRSESVELADFSDFAEHWSN